MRLVLLKIICLQLFLLHVASYPSYSNYLGSAYIPEKKLGDQKQMAKLSTKAEDEQKISVADRRGGAGGGHASGHAGGRGSHGHSGMENSHGDDHTKSVIPLYATGAMNHHHRSASTLNYIGLPHLASIILTSLIFIYVT
ncbi:unnamed protein product [Ilex paraguariensis]|uniref:Uncharacterized protein n=1 Tax=Ilex paraguariensis TaxID=185542 RepID=A0ABC8U7J8_9AQUA